jgi:hypothetical protein
MNKRKLLIKRAKLLCLAPISVVVDSIDMALFFLPLGLVAYPAYLAVRTAEIIFSNDTDIERM